MSIPSLSDTMAAASSGSMFRDITGPLSTITQSASQLPPSLSAQFTAATANVQSQVAAAQGTFKTASSISATYAEVLNKQAQAAGTTVDTKAACGPLAIFAQVKELLNSIKTSIQEGISKLLAPINELKDKFGAAFAELQDKISAVATAVTDAAKELAQQALDLFKEANKALSDAFSAINDKVSEMAKGLTDGIKGAIDAGKAALKSAIGAIKDFAASIKLSLPFNAPCLADAKDIAIDSSKMMPNISLPSLDSAIGTAKVGLSTATDQFSNAIASGNQALIASAQAALTTATENLKSVQSVASTAANLGNKNLSTLMQQASLPAAKPTGAADTGTAAGISTPSIEQLTAAKDDATTNFKQASDALDEVQARGINLVNSGYVPTATLAELQKELNEKTEAYKEAAKVKKASEEALKNALAN